MDVVSPYPPIGVGSIYMHIFIYNVFLTTQHVPHLAKCLGLAPVLVSTIRIRIQGASSRSDCAVTITLGVKFLNFYFLFKHIPALSIFSDVRAQRLQISEY